MTLGSLLILPGAGLALLALAGCAYAVTATALSVRHLRTARPQPASAGGVTLLKPLHGDYPEMLETLRAFCRQDHEGPVQVLFGVQRADDPAVAVVRTLQAECPDADIELVIDATPHGANRKVANLINMARRIRHGVVVLSDADITVKPDYARRIFAELSAPGVGAVSVLYVGVDDGRLWTALSAMAISYHFLPNAVMGKALGMAEPCFGSTIALTRETLGRIGGFEAFADLLADDYEIGRAVRGLGLKLAVPPMVVGHHCLEASFSEMLAHELRWGRTVRQIDPGGYAGSLITYPLPLAILAAPVVALWSLPAALIMICIALGVRIGCKFAMDAATGACAGRWWMIPLRDVLSVYVFIASFAVDTVDWRGVTFQVERDGALTHRKG